MVIASVLREAISHAISEIASSAEEQQTQDDGSFKDVRTFVRRSEDTLDNSFQLTQNQFRKSPGWQRSYQHLQRKSPMAHKKRTLSVIGVSLSLLWLVACSPTVPTSTPTLDLNPFRTEVAATVLAQVTRALASTPSVTPLSSPTAMNLPTSTPSLTVSPSPSATATLSSGTPKAGTENRAQWVANQLQMTLSLHPARPSQ